MWILGLNNGDFMQTVHRESKIKKAAKRQPFLFVRVKLNLILIGVLLQFLYDVSVFIVNVY